MKVVLYTAGLGNQLFQYCFCRWLQERYPRERILGCYDPAILANHNGLEIDKVFDIALPPTNKLAYIIERLIRAQYKRTNWTFFSSHDEPFKDTLYYEGYWHNKIFVDPFLSELRFIPSLAISKQNQAVLLKIQQGYSVSLHVRRGDYLKPEFEKDFAHSCTPLYYENAIQYVLKKHPEANFFVFSDDIPWVKDNLPIPNAIFVDWNRGKESFWDMRLMSECNACIIANSSFSYWGARLGREKDFVIRPAKWIGNEVPDIFPEKWKIL